MLNENVFWEIIDKSLKNSNDCDEQEIYLIKEISKLNKEDIIGFKLRLIELSNNIYTSHMWCAGYLMNGGCSDDAFEDFKNWVISKGKEVYYNAKNNPDTLEAIYNDDDYYEFESLSYVANDAFEKVTGKNIYDYLPTNIQSDIEFDWEEDEPETMEVICPKIFEKSGWE